MNKLRFGGHPIEIAPGSAPIATGAANAKADHCAQAEMRPAAPPLSRRFSVAPMMDCTDRHCRYFHRLLTRRALLYTEMLAANAVIHGDRARLLAHRPEEHPVALQLGGADPAPLAEAAAIGAAHGYVEINLNVGCPSGRVRDGCFGAALMAEPARVAACVAAMRSAVAVPVTVKCRTGIDNLDSEAHLIRFVETVAAAGATTFIVHARKAWLSGLSPKENREIPPLDYERVYRLKARFPELEIVINGGITSLDAARAHLAHVDGVMLGRAAYHDPWLLAGVDAAIYGAPQQSARKLSRSEVLRAMMRYAEEECARGEALHRITRHMLGLCRGRPGARTFRRILSEGACRPGAGPEVIAEALAAISRMRQVDADQAKAQQC